MAKVATTGDPITHHALPPHPSLPRSASGLQGNFKLVALYDLPVVDTTLNLRRLVLGAHWDKRHVAIMRRCTPILSLSYFVGLIYRLYGMLVPARLSGHWWLLLSFFLQVIPVMNNILSMRSDFVRQLMKSFDFWFFSVMNLVWAIAIVVGYHDSRSSIVLITWLEFTNANLLDASVYRSRDAAKAAFLAAATMAVGVLGIAVGLIEVRDVVVWRTPRGHVLYIAAVLANAMGTIALLMVRIAYRTHTDSHSKTSRMLVRCSLYRCRLQFAPAHHSIRVLPQPLRLPPHCFQLEYAEINDVFDANDVVFRRATNWHLPRWTRWVWTLVLISALALLLLLLATPPTSGIHYHPQLSSWVPFLTVSINMVAAAPILALHHRQLLRRLFGSFDFVFVLLQLVAISVCVCHLMQWVPQRCAIVGCVTIWFYVVATNDALTPAAKHALRWTTARPTFVAVLLFLVHLVLVLELAAFAHWDIQDRLLLDTMVFGHRVQVFAVPFLFSRLAIILVWIGRIVWRLAVCCLSNGGENELITLRGAVQYQKRKAPIQEVFFRK